MKRIRISMTREEAETIQFGLSDAACWMRGFIAASPDSSNGPMGQEEIRRMNEKLKAALNASPTATEEAVNENESTG